MDLTPETKKFIDGLSYESLLNRWRFAPVGDQMFVGETGNYWGERMKLLRAQHLDPAQVSKNLGWER